MPLLVFGGLSAVSPCRSKKFAEWFEVSRPVAIVLTLVAWFWTAYELSIIGIDVFDSILFKEATGGKLVWVLAPVLSFLTVVWMPKNLPVRSLTGILMLIPAELFKATRPILPESGFAAVQVLVAAAYIGAVVGMYGMFYPWRLEKGLRLVQERPALCRALGAALAVFGAAVTAVGFAL